MDIIYELAARRIYSVEKGEFPNAGIRYVSAPYSPSLREKLLQTIDNFNLRVFGNYIKFLN